MVANKSMIEYWKKGCFKREESALKSSVRILKEVKIPIEKSSMRGLCI